jgi:hypothetical protein
MASERQQPLPMRLKLLIFSGFGEVNVSQFASQFVSRILVDGGDASHGRRIKLPYKAEMLRALPKRNVLWPSPTTRSPAFRRLLPRRICPTKPCKHPTVQRDHEYKRLGTVTLSAPSSGIENFSPSLGSSVAES